MSAASMLIRRREVEKELQQKSASIAGSISRIKKDLSLPTEPVRSVVRDHPLESLLATVALGLVTGWLVGGKKKKVDRPSRKDSGRASDLATSEFLHLVGSGRAAGLSEEEAVARALRLTSAPHAQGLTRSLTDRLGDQAVAMAETVVKTAFRVVIQEAANWLSEAIRRDKRPRSQ